MNDCNDDNVAVKPLHQSPLVGRHTIEDGKRMCVCVCVRRLCHHHHDAMEAT